MSRLCVGYIGIDPGSSGGMALLTASDEALFFDWPESGDVQSIWNALLDWKERYRIDGVALERVHSMTGQGVKSVFSFGRNLGVWQGLLTASGLSWIFPTPQEWQKRFIKPSDGDTTKARSLAVARRMFPDAELTGKRGGILAGRPDALLMAAYARVILG